MITPRSLSSSRMTGRSRDNLPNPTMSPSNPYVPMNMPAVGDMFDMFDFGDFK